MVRLGSSASNELWTIVFVLSAYTPLLSLHPIPTPPPPFKSSGYVKSALIILCGCQSATSPIKINTRRIFKFSSIFCLVPE